MAPISKLRFLIHVARAGVVASAVTLLVLMACLITAIRFAPPFAEPEAGLVAGVLEARLGRAVRVGSVSIRLAGLSPRLMLRDLRLSDPGRRTDVLRLESLEVGIDLIASLLAAQPRISALTLERAKLSVRLDRDGRVTVEGLDLLRGGDPATLEPLLRRGRLELVHAEIRILDERLGAAEVQLADVRLSLRSQGNRHVLTLAAQPQTGGSGPMPRGQDPGSGRVGRLALIGDLSGPPGDPRSWGGRLYAALDAGGLNQTLDEKALGVARIRADRARVESWYQIRAGRLDEAVLGLDLAGFSVEPLATEASAAPLQLEHVAARIRASHGDEGWRLQIGDLAGRLKGSDLPQLDLDLVFDPDRRAGSLMVASDGLDLAALVSQLATSPWALPEPMFDLIGAAPRGRIDRLAVRVDWSPDSQARWAATASVQGLGWDRVGGVPGVDGLSAQLRANQQRGEARLSSAALALDRRPLFSEPLLLDRFSGLLEWRKEPAGALRVSGRDLMLEHGDLRGRAGFVLHQPGDGSSPELDLRASIRDGDASRLGPYLPDGIMPPDLVGWLDRSIVSGRVPQADLLFRGPLAAYPFRDHKGRFELIVNFADAVLDYQAGWPRIENASGRLRFLNQGLAIALDSGRIYESRLTSAHAEIPDLWVVQRIGIQGEAQGPFADGLRVLAETPLSDDLGRLGDLLEVTGQARLLLDLDVPFTPDRSLGVSGRVSWPSAATLAIKDTELRLAGLDGGLSFTEDRLVAEAIEADLWGQPMTLSMAPLNRGKADTAATAIRFRSRTPVAELARRFPDPAWGVLAGELDWELEVNLRHQDLRVGVSPLEYRLSSNLRGLSIDLPSPLGKADDGKRNLEVTGSLVPGQSMRIVGRVGEVAGDISVDLGRSPPRLARGRLRFGGESAPAPTRDGVYVDGRLAELNLPEWWGRAHAVARRQSIASSSPHGHLAPWLVGVDLKLDRLSLGGPRLTDVALTLKPGPEATGFGGWEVDVRAKELSGRLKIDPAEDRPLDLDLERLDLLALLAERDAEASAVDTVLDTRTLEGLPAVDARVRNLSWGDAPLGALELALRPDPLGVRAPTIGLGGGGLIAAIGEAAWARSPGRGRSELSMQIETTDTGAVLTALDSQNHLEQAPMKAKVVLDWPGGFSDFSWARALGFVDLEVGAGRLLHVEPGLGRILGFLNLNALSRRLAMDFSDLYGEGFAFEEMKGRIGVADGQAVLDDFTIDGPSIKVLVSGPSDLVNERFDQRVMVEPKLGSSIALASAVAGGPVFGAAVYLVDRIAGNPIDRLGRYQYRITGPWRAPDLHRIGWDPAVGGESMRGMPGDSSVEDERNHFLD